jgi:hypothetical protein
MKKRLGFAVVAVLLSLLISTPAAVAAPRPPAPAAAQSRLVRDSGDRTALARILQRLAARFGVHTQESLPIPPRP